MAIINGTACARRTRCRSRRAWRAGAAAVFLLLFGYLPAYAYINPTAGSMLLQLLLGGGVVVIVALRIYWGKIKSLIDWVARRQKSRDD